MSSIENKHNITLSDSAAQRIGYLSSQEEDKGKKLRISVIGGGCSGFQYKYEFVASTDKDDLVIHKDKATVVIDQTSADLINNSEINYVQTLGFEHFEIRNPNAASKCGCGNSFSI
ncbi:MAG: iron-sulfur cluster assembly accessory protein [Rickettsiales bacterium]